MSRQAGRPWSRRYRRTHAFILRALLVMSDSYVTQAYYRGFEDYYADQMKSGGC